RRAPREGARALLPVGCGLVGLADDDTPTTAAQDILVRVAAVAGLLADLPVGNTVVSAAAAAVAATAGGAARAAAAAASWRASGAVGRIDGGASSRDGARWNRAEGSHAAIGVHGAGAGGRDALAAPAAQHAFRVGDTGALLTAIRGAGAGFARLTTRVIGAAAWHEQGVEGAHAVDGVAERTAVAGLGAGGVAARGPVGQVVLAGVT